MCKAYLLANLFTRAITLLCRCCRYRHCRCWCRCLRVRIIVFSVFTQSIYFSFCFFSLCLSFFHLSVFHTSCPTAVRWWCWNTRKKLKQKNNRKCALKCKSLFIRANLQPKACVLKTMTKPNIVRNSWFFYFASPSPRCLHFSYIVAAAVRADSWKMSRKYRWN